MRPCHTLTKSKINKNPPEAPVACSIPFSPGNSIFGIKGLFQFDAAGVTGSDGSGVGRAFPDCTTLAASFTFIDEDASVTVMDVWLAGTSTCMEVIPRISGGTKTKKVIAEKERRREGENEILINEICREKKKRPKEAVLTRFTNSARCIFQF